MEYEKDIRVTPERTEVMINVTAEGAERLTTVKEIKYAPQEEYHDPMTVTPERTEQIINVTAEGVERLTTVHEIKYAPQEEYHGPTTVTPSAETQILNTAGLLVAADITINPIPSNYGLVTWNGSTLTVS